MPSACRFATLLLALSAHGARAFAPRGVESKSQPLPQTKTAPQHKKPPSTATSAASLVATPSRPWSPGGASSLLPEGARPSPALPPRSESELRRLGAAARSDRVRIGTLDVPAIAVGTIGWTPPPKEPAPGGLGGFAKLGFRVPLPGDRLSSSLDASATAARQDDAVELALASGLHLFDTAERYSVGDGERLLAAAVRRADDAHTGGRAAPRRRDDASAGGADAAAGTPFAGARHRPAAVIATKFTPTPWRRDAASVVEACAASRERLGVDAIDLYQLHMPDIVKPLAYFTGTSASAPRNDAAYWDGLAECYHSGLVKNVGVSNYGPTLLARAHAHLAARGVPLASNQFHYSLLARHRGEQATVDACRALGVKPLAYYPLAMGLLTSSFGKNSNVAAYAKGGAATMGQYIPAGGVAPLVATLERIGTRHGGKSAAQVALNWVAAKGAVPIAGATRATHVADNVGALGWRLSRDEVAELEAASDALGFEFRGTWFKRTDSKFVGYGVERWELD